MIRVPGWLRTIGLVAAGVATYDVVAKKMLGLRFKKGSAGELQMKLEKLADEQKKKFEIAD